MFNSIIKQASASDLGTEFVPQADALGSSGTMDLFWPVLGILVIAGIAGAIAYKIFFT
jgi:hypothetical protein